MFDRQLAGSMYRVPKKSAGVLPVSPCENVPVVTGSGRAAVRLYLNPYFNETRSGRSEIDWKKIHARTTFF